MKVRKLNGYVPEYPAKSLGLRLGTIAAAAVLAAGTAIGCVSPRPELMGDFPADTSLPESTEEATLSPETTGLIGVDETPEAADEP